MKKKFVKTVLALCLTAALGGMSLGVEAVQLSGNPVETSFYPTQSFQEHAADCPVYRGTVVDIFQDGEMAFFTLRQEQGTNFGIAEILVQAPISRTDGIKVGDYIEISYTFSQADPQIAQALSLKKLTDAALSNYNGEVISIDRQNSVILCRDWESSSETLFHYTDSTQMYFDFDSLKQGDKINIYHSGALTRSLPPQGNALEIRRYADIQIYRGTIASISASQGERTLTLQRAPGTDFSDSITVTINDSTLQDGSLSVGEYAEVLCNNDGSHYAYSVKLLLPWESCVYNCTLEEKIYGESGSTEGSLVVKGLSAGDTVIFHYDAYTKFAQEVESLQPGDQLSIYHRGTMTLSLPAQANALEVSPYRP